MSGEGEQQLETPRQPYDGRHDDTVQMVLMIGMINFYKSHGGHDPGDSQ
jgi:hypothetical protein